jgi:hypothetical protein
MYRYGDGTPFPLPENFIETLVAAVDCCVAIYQVEARVEEHAARQREARRRAADELRRLDALHGLIETAVAPLIQHKDERSGRASEQAAGKIFEAATSIIRNSRAGVTRRRETATHEVLAPAVLEGVPAALGQFFSRHQLPRTEWHAHWQATPEAGASAEISGQVTRDLELVFRASFAEDGFWSRPIPMAELFGVPVNAVIDGGKGRRRQVRLDPTVLTELQVAPGREAMVLREATKRTGLALHILMPRPGEPAPLVVALDRRDKGQGQPFYLDEVGARAVLGAWRALQTKLPELVAARDELVAARLAGRDVSEVEHPAQMAEGILHFLAPLVREMRIRSRVPGELILKRDLASDRREEIFVPRQALWTKIAALPPRHRQLFEAIGLGNEATFEFVARVSQQPARPRARPPLSTPDGEPPELPTMESYGFERDPDMLDAGRPRRSTPPATAPRGAPASEPAAPEPAAESTSGDLSGEEGVSEVELTNPRPEQSEVSVVSGIIERATG